MNGKKMFLITANGRDRPGMVAAVAQKLFETNCSIQDATMTRLSGEFAMILVVAPSADTDSSTLAQILAPLRDSHGLQIYLNPIGAPETEGATETRSHTRYMLSVYGPDHTGLVAGVSKVLAEHHVNITDLQTRIAGGKELFVMLFELEIPTDLNSETLRKKLDTVTDELNLEYSLNPIEEDTL